MSTIDLENAVACIEILTLPWPNGNVLTCELIYHLSLDGLVLDAFPPAQKAALQALVNYRKPLEHMGKGSSLEVMSEEEQALFDALSETILTPEQRRERTAMELVRALHEPVAISDDWGFVGGIQVCEDGTPLMEMVESGPNWSARYTLYILELEPDVRIAQAYSPCSRSPEHHCSNSHFQRVWRRLDESGLFDDLPGQLARLSQDAAEVECWSQ